MIFSITFKREVVWEIHVHAARGNVKYVLVSCGSKKGGVARVMVKATFMVPYLPPVTTTEFKKNSFQANCSENVSL